jgi:hypothetical protein
LLPIETLRAETGGIAWLDDGTPITGDTARRMACDAGITRVITGGRSEILDLGRLTPVPSAAQRRAVTLRDGACTFAGCNTPSGRCQVHHIIHYGRGRTTGGSTDLANLTLLCCRHHHLVHEGGFHLKRNPVTGSIETRRPNGTLIPTRPRAGPLSPIPPSGPDLEPYGRTNHRTPRHPQAQTLDLGPGSGTDVDPLPAGGDAASPASDGGRGSDHDPDSDGRLDADGSSDRDRSLDRDLTPASDLDRQPDRDLTADLDLDLDRSWSAARDSACHPASECETDSGWDLDGDHRPGCDDDAPSGY